MLQDYKIQDGESVFDVVLKLYGTLELYGQYMQDNINNYANYEIVATTLSGVSFYTEGNTTSIFYVGYSFTYNNQIYNVISSFLNIDETTRVTINPGGPTLPYGPGSATIILNIIAIPPLTALYNPDLYISSPPELTRSAVIPSTIRALRGQDGQSIYDICMMAYGDIGEVYRLLQDSGIDSIDERGLAGTLFTYDTTFIADSTFYNYITSEGIIINTGEGPDATVYLTQQNYYLILQENGYGIVIIP